jgi:hypothetical protein
MGFGQWHKIKQGTIKVLGGVGKGLDTIGKVGGIVSGIGGLFGMNGGLGDVDGLQPRFKNRVGAGGAGIWHGYDGRLNRD